MRWRSLLMEKLLLVAELPEGSGIHLTAFTSSTGDSLLTTLYTSHSAPLSSVACPQVTAMVDPVPASSTAAPGTGTEGSL